MRTCSVPILSHSLPIRAALTVDVCDIIHDDGRSRGSRGSSS
jgi:hypothetical protein